MHNVEIHQVRRLVLPDTAQNPIHYFVFKNVFIIKRHIRGRSRFLNVTETITLQWTVGNILLARLPRVTLVMMLTVSNETDLID